jgi:hypothetical protein
MKSQLILKGILIALCTISIVSFFYKPITEDYKKNHGHSWEEYDPSFFFKFQSINDVIEAANKQFAPTEKNSLQYYNYVAEIIRKRFYHGYSYYNMSDNPIVFLAGKFSANLSAIVIPDDIMKHPMAACSQQAIVLMEVFKRTGVGFRKITFNHHFTVEANIENKWRYFDADIEPRLQDERESLHELLATKQFDSAYAYAVTNMAGFYKILGTPRYGKINEAPAPRAEVFHKLCLFLISKYFLLSVLILMIFSSVTIHLKNRYLAPMGEFYMPIGVNVSDNEKA